MIQAFILSLTWCSEADELNETKRVFCKKNRGPKLISNVPQPVQDFLAEKGIITTTLKLTSLIGFPVNYLDNLSSVRPPISLPTPNANIHSSIENNYEEHLTKKDPKIAVALVPVTLPFLTRLGKIRKIQTEVRS